MILRRFSQRTESAAGQCRERGSKAIPHCRFAVEIKNLETSHLESARPVTRAALGVRDGDDFNCAWKFAVNNEVRITIKQNAPCAVEIRCEKSRRFTQGTVGGVELFVEFERGYGALASVVPKCRICLGSRIRVKPIGFHLCSATCLSSSLRRAFISARTTLPGIIFTAPESISSRRRLISSPQVASISAAEGFSSSGPMLSRSDSARRILCLSGSAWA